MSAMASQITGVSIVCPTVCSGADERENQNFASLFPFDDVIMLNFVGCALFLSLVD